MIWLRQTMPTCRPDLVDMTYHWRYAESVHAEVSYGDSSCPKWGPDVCTGTFRDIPVGGDVCGGRAFWGRFSRKGFGVPTWGATEHAHAAMSSWTPSGWNVLLGAPWPDCYWGSRGGQDFVLETQARTDPAGFQQVLRAGWVSAAKNEAHYNAAWSTGDFYVAKAFGTGGLWSALTLYMQKIQVAAAPATNITIPAAANNKIQAFLAQSSQPMPPAPPVTTAADGTITIPAVSFTSKNRSAPVVVIRSFDGGSQLISNGCTSSVGPPCFVPASSSVSYDVSAAAAGSYYLSANFSTYHMDQDLYVSVNGAKNVEVGMFYTIAFWNQTQPVEVALNKGATLPGPIFTILTVFGELAAGLGVGNSRMGANVLPALNIGRFGLLMGRCCGLFPGARHEHTGVHPDQWPRRDLQGLFPLREGA